ncbi:MAG: P-II family nitrogen regulator [Euryarchaeota archaeon]|nr:P-II family nitrogen regulator [Euryarchaeota archaeon]
MRLIRAIVRPEKEFEVIEALEKAGFAAMTKTDVLGRGRQRGLQVGATRYDEVAKVMLMLVVEGERVATAVEVIKTAARTGNFGDGKIFVTPVDTAYTIRTGERGL